PLYLSIITTSVTIRSHVPFFDVHPRPYSLRRVPDWETAGTLSITWPPSSVGTAIVAPCTASGKVIGTVIVRFFPRIPNTGCTSTCTVTTRSPGSPPVGLGCPLPRSRIFCPSCTPAGMRTFIDREPSRVRVTVAPSTAERNGSEAEVVMYPPLVGDWNPARPPAPPPKSPTHMSSKPPPPGIDPPVEEYRTRGPPPAPPAPNIPPNRSSKPADPAVPPGPEANRGPPPAMARSASYCLRCSASESTA